MTTMNTPRITAIRPGLGDARAVWEVTACEANDDGLDRKPNGRFWTIELEAHPLTSNRTIAHQVWLHLNQQPDIPEVDILSPQARLLGFAADEPDEDGKPPRLHGVRCTKCGAPHVTFASRAWANCRSCGHGQMQDEATLCSDQCDECTAAGAADE